MEFVKILSVSLRIKEYIIKHGVEIQIPKGYKDKGHVDEQAPFDPGPMARILPQKRGKSHVFETL